MFVLLLETGDELVGCIEQFARKNKIVGAQITALGSLSDISLACFDWKTKKYKKAVEIRQQVQVLSFIGDIAHEKGEPKAHCYLVVAKQDGAVYGGHLLQAHVRPALEVILMEASQYFQRRYDPDSGLALIRPEPHPHKL